MAISGEDEKITVSSDDVDASSDVAVKRAGGVLCPPLAMMQGGNRSSPQGRGRGALQIAEELRERPRRWWFRRCRRKSSSSWPKKGLKKVVLGVSVGGVTRELVSSWGGAGVGRAGKDAGVGE